MFRSKEDKKSYSFFSFFLSIASQISLHFDEQTNRVIKKLFSALNRNLEYPVGQNGDSSSELGVWGRVVPGLGFHDVVIETPIHSVLLSDLNPSEIGDVFIAYKRRIEQIKGFESIKYFQVREKKNVFW